jgi:dolichol-phosphate mannosyltransferase
MKKISIVIPIYNEEANIHAVYDRLDAITAQLPQYAFEFICVNDGSRDASWHIIQQLSLQDDRVKGVSFSRNFGFQMALTAGHDHATGDAIITIDADLQDPPELIMSMVEAWQRGFYIVYARRMSRNDGFFKDITASLYYKLLTAVADVPIPENVGDFRLIDRAVLNQINTCRERYRYWRGMVAWTGFPHTFVYFTRPERTAGQTGYTWLKLFKLAFDGITSFSMFPLKLAAYSGVFVIITGSCMFAYITWDAFFCGARYPLFKWLVTIIYIFMGVQFLLMWLLGEYIGRMHDEQKQRPLYIIQDVCGLKEQKIPALLQGNQQNMFQ